MLQETGAFRGKAASTCCFPYPVGAPPREAGCHFSACFQCLAVSFALLLTFQSTGVATFLYAVSCRESTTLRISSKFLPVVAGYRMESFSFLSGPKTNT